MKRDDFITTWVAEFCQRRDKVINALNNIDGITMEHKTSGAFYLFPCCKGLFNKTTPQGIQLLTSSDVATYFLEEAQVAIVPGIAFGAEGYFRISYATSLDILLEACSRIQNAVNKLK